MKSKDGNMERYFDRDIGGPSGCILHFHPYYYKASCFKMQLAFCFRHLTGMFIVRQEGIRYAMEN